MDIYLSEKEFKSLNRQINQLKKTIKQYAQNFLKDNYNLQLNIPIKFRFKNMNRLGQFTHEVNGLPLYLQLNTKYLYYPIINNNISEIFDTLRHELIHYALFTKNLPYSDGDITFEKELIKYNTSSSCDTPDNKLLKYSHKNNVKGCILSDIYDYNFLMNTGKPMIMREVRAHTQRANNINNKFQRVAIKFKVI